MEGDFPLLNSDWSTEYTLFCKLFWVPESPMEKPPLPVDQEIVAAIRRIIRAVDLHSRRLVDTCGLTGPQLAALQEVSRRGSITASVLARAVNLSQATVTGIVSRLEKRGLVRRVPVERDRRSMNVEVTEQGRVLLATAPSLLQDRFRTALDELADWERSMILATLQRIASIMDAEGLDASPHLVSGAAFATNRDASEQPRPGAVVAQEKE